MRFMVIVKGGGGCGAAKPNEKFIAEMRDYNEALAKAGILVTLERLHPGAEGVRVSFSGTKPIVSDGPFAETKEFVGGLWLWQVKSKEEAIEWVKRCPFPGDAGVEIEIRQVIEPDELAPTLVRQSGSRGRHAQADSN